MSGFYPIRGVVMDLDDTLYPEWRYLESGLAAVADWLGGTDAAMRTHWRRKLRDEARHSGRNGILDRIPTPAGIAETDWRATLLHVYRTHTPDLQPFDDVMAFLEHCRAYGCRIGMVSDGKSCVQHQKVAALGLHDLFDAIVFSDDIDCAKPSSRPFAVVCARVGLPPDQCVYVADDASKDFIGPHQLGMHTIQVSRSLAFSLARPAPDTAADARHRVASLVEAAKLIFGE